MKENNSPRLSDPGDMALRMELDGSQLIVRSFRPGRTKVQPEVGSLQEDEEEPPPPPTFELLGIDDENPGAACVCVWSKEKQVATKSLMLFHIRGRIRQKVLVLVEWHWFERLVLLAICLNTLLLAIYQHRQPKDSPLNFFIDRVGDPILTTIFTAECVLKIFAWGAITSPGAYLREGWNWLDLIIVVSALLSQIPTLSQSGVTFLRVFRVLRPLRSLEAFPQMKVLVNTILVSIQRLSQVAVLGGFLFTVLSITGVQLFHGAHYRQCRTTEQPVLIGGCWSWNFSTFTGPTPRICGGYYNCEDVHGFCSGHMMDPDPLLRPTFPNGTDLGAPWCEGSAPSKPSWYPSLDTVHMDNFGAAALLLFQCMTDEGWSDYLYQMQDAVGLWTSTIFFFTQNVLNSILLVHIALAVIDEARDDFQEKAKENGSKSLIMGHVRDSIGSGSSLVEMGTHSALGRMSVARVDMFLGINKFGKENRFLEDIDVFFDSEMWWNVAPVRWCWTLVHDEHWNNFIMLVVTGNVVTMMLDSFPPKVAWAAPLQTCSWVFLSIFIVEMIISIIGLGPKEYVSNPVTALDGIVLIGSIIEISLGGAGAVKALRTLRLLRILNKLAAKWLAFRVLLKAMLHTAISLHNWVILFALMMLIWSLTFMHVFSNQMHFSDASTFAHELDNQGEPWCPGTEGMIWNKRQACIPKSNFDTFLWSFATIFQVMTEENWNSVLFASLRALGPAACLLYLALILFGTIMFVNLFLSLLISTFDKVQDEVELIEMKRAEELKNKRPTDWGVVRAIRVSLLSAAAYSKAATNVVGRRVSRLAWTRQSFGSASSEQVDSRSPAQSVVGASADVSKEAAAMAAANPHKHAGASGAASASVASLQAVGDKSANTESAAPSGVAKRVHFKKAKAPDEGIEEEAGDEESPVAAEVLEELPLPGQLNAGRRRSSNCRANKKLMGSNSLAALDASDESEILLTDVTDVAPKWPHGYSLFILSRASRARSFLLWLLTVKVRFRGEKFKVFDNFILVCILCSSICLACDSPMRDPRDSFTVGIRITDQVFACVFLCEMVVKICAMGLCWGEGTYLRNGWNWLDALVVGVSLVDFVGTNTQSGILKTLRLLRTLRPLRVISTNQNLKMVVLTVFASFQDLAALAIVSSLFLLMFALITVMYLSGKMNSCSTGSPQTVFMLDAGSNFVTPICLETNTSLWALQQGPFHEIRGTWNSKLNVWQGADQNCSTASRVPWSRASADTPMCVASCDAYGRGNAPDWLCPKKYTTAEELPHQCPGPRVSDQFEQVGMSFLAALTRNLLVPCGGSTVVNGTVDRSMQKISCAANFCPGGVDDKTHKQCVHDCHAHPFFCQDSCKDSRSKTCEACQEECVAACECGEFCQPLIKDAALCTEQGSSWGQVSQTQHNFNNIFNAMMALVAVTCTETWVDLMDAATDSQDAYTQPLRDGAQWIWVPFFICWMLLSYWFLLNVSVGVILDKFMDFKAQGQETLLTDRQRRWLASRKRLVRNNTLFDVVDLHLFGRWRRQLYYVITHKNTENCILVVIGVNTLVMCCTYFPTPFPWWDDIQESVDGMVTCIFCLEAFLKILVLRWRYFARTWNIFDFVVSIATAAGMLLRYAVPGMTVFAGASIIRLFRLARLFRVARVLKGLNKIFRAVSLTLPKLGNVAALLVLLQSLFCILGVNLFSSVKYQSNYSVHASFKDFFFGYVTLFRAQTGEAWPYVMYEIAAGEADWFAMNSFCVPSHLFDTSSSYDILKDKCLLDQPSACVTTLFGLNIVSQVFFVAYWITVTVVCFNLVIAVILEGYEEGKDNPEDEAMESCVQLWKKYDPDHKLVLPFHEAVKFIQEVIAKRSKSMYLDERSKELGMMWLTASGKVNVPLRIVQLFDLHVQKDGTVSFFSAAKQVMRFSVLGGEFQRASEIDAADDALDSAQLERLQSLEADERSRRLQGHSIAELVAAMKVQQQFRSFMACKAAKSEAHFRRQSRMAQPINLEPEPESKHRVIAVRSPRSAEDILEGFLEMNSVVQRAVSEPARLFPSESIEQLDDEGEEWV